jgi:hypothetical protein
MKEPETYWGQSRSEFNISLEKIVALARYQIIFSDIDFEDWPIESKQFADLLTQALLRMKEATRVDQTNQPIAPLTLLVQNTTWLEKKAPRMARIRNTYPSLVSMKLVPQELSGSDCLAIVDKQHGVIRPHKDSFRAKTIIAQPSEVETRVAKLRQIAELSAICLPTTTLGL